MFSGNEVEIFAKKILFKSYENEIGNWKYKQKKKKPKRH